MANQQVTLDFQQGLNTKTDPWQLPVGQFQVLENSVFNKQGMLQKRNGYQRISTLPSTNYNYITTLNDNLNAIGENIAAYNAATESWILKGQTYPASVSVLPLVRNSLSQIQCDSAIFSDGTSCTVYTETSGNNAFTYKYVVASSKGQNIVEPTVLVPTAGVVSGSPRVFIVGNYFVIMFTALISSTSHLQYFTVPVSDPSNVTTTQDLATSYGASPRLSWDGVSFSDRLYVAYDTTSGGQSIRITYLTLQNLILSQSPAAPHTFTSEICTVMSLSVDTTSSNPAIYLSYYDSSSSVGKTAAVDAGLNVLLAPTTIIASGTVTNIACAAQNGVCTTFYGIANTYGYNSIATNFVNSRTCSITGTLGTAKTVVRSLDVGSKAFIISGNIYFLGAYQSSFQSTYFLVSASSTQASPVLVAKLAYENGGGYPTLGLPSVTVNGTMAQMAYLYKDLVTSLSTLNNTQQTTSGGIYAQTGVNLGSIDLGYDNVTSVEVANGLQFGGGFGWMYDGFQPVEQNFFVWPEDLGVTTSATAVTPTGTVTSGSNVITAVSSMVGVGLGASVSGASIPAAQVVTGFTSNSITFGPLTATGSHTAEAITVTGNISTAQPYFYQAIYRWVDDSGNVHQSAPSIPVSVTTTGSTSTNTINIPTLRLTYKTVTPVTVNLYRWSANQQIYFQVTSFQFPTQSSTLVDSVVVYDSLSDLSIDGNQIIYTEGGVVEDVNPPASTVMTLFDTRAWLVNAEDPNQLWFSKQVIEATPVEWSDLFTLYIAPNAGTVSTTGPITALAPMDDKLIIFKENAIYYINGIGPDNTGTPSPSYNGPIYITSTVGCSDPRSIVLIDSGLMFQSNKGIWLLGRGLGPPVYIGAAVEEFNAATVQSAVSVPTTNQTRQTLSTGQTVMFDYFYNQWGTFAGVPAVSSCIYSNLHSFINQFGEVYQEAPGTYVDGTKPVLLNLTTGWINIASLQGFERLKYFYFLGRFLSPHQMQVGISYDYVDSVVQSSLIKPDNFSSSAPSPFGDQSAPFGGPTDVYQWKIHAKRQKCQAFKITLTEVYDSTYGVPPGAGFTLSGINMIVMAKRASKPIKAANTIG